MEPASSPNDDSHGLPIVDDDSANHDGIIAVAPEKEEKKIIKKGGISKKTLAQIISNGIITIELKKVKGNIL